MFKLSRLDIHIDFDDLGSDEMFGIFIGGLVFLFIVALVVIFAKAIVELRNSNKPRETQRVKLIDKGTNLGNGSYMAIFETEAGHRVRLAVNIPTLVVGDVGTLVWQGTEFISFTREKTGFN